MPPREHTVRGLFRGEGHIYSNRIRWAILGTLAVALLAGGLAVNNEYIRQHRTLQVINACGAPVQVRVDDQPPQTVADTGRIVLAEGRHRIQLGGAVEETHDVDIQANYFDRWLQKPAWILVPGGEAPIIKHVVTYSKDPVPPAFELLLGQPFVALPQVDYLFEEPPQNMNLRSRNAQVIKIWLERFAGSDTQAFEFGVHNDRERALTFAESRLRRRPEDNELLQAYLSSFQLGHMERAGIVPRDGAGATSRRGPVAPALPDARGGGRPRRGPGRPIRRLPSRRSAKRRPDLPAGKDRGGLGPADRGDPPVN